ncbi:MFS transporter [Streptomyces sp. NPDC059176]|uniref:MFS transporter n=1 Tax=unclassified Streptomyces TaxID=2593676 RepID=UPI003678BA92
MTSPPLAPPHRTTYREVLAERRFRLLFLSRTVAITADSLRISAFSVLVFATTGSPLLSAVSFGAGFLPQMLGTVLLGSLADRLPPRALIAGGYLLEAAAVSVLALLPLPIAVSLSLVVLVALVTPVFHGASGRLVAKWLTGDAYVLGRSLNNMASSAAQLVGLAIGGAAVAALGARQALVVGGALHLLAAAAVRWGLPDVPPEGGPSGSLVRSSMSGAGGLFRFRGARRLLLAQWLPGAFTAGAEGLLIAYAGQQRFAAGAYALLMAALPVGMLLGDLIVGRLLRPSVRELLVVPLVAVMGLPLLVFVTRPGVVPSIVLLVVTGTGFAYALGLQRAFLDCLPVGAQGQAFGMVHSGAMTGQGLGPLLFGGLATAVGTGPAMAAAGGATVLTACWIASWRSSGPTTPTGP